MVSLIFKALSPALRTQYRHPCASFATTIEECMHSKCGRRKTARLCVLAIRDLDAHSAEKGGHLHDRFFKTSRSEESRECCVLLSQLSFFSFIKSEWLRSQGSTYAACFSVAKNMIAVKPKGLSALRAY